MTELLNTLANFKFVNFKLLKKFIGLSFLMVGYHLQVKRCMPGCYIEQRIK